VDNLTNQNTQPVAWNRIIKIGEIVRELVFSREKNREDT